MRVCTHTYTHTPKLAHVCVCAKHESTTKKCYEIKQFVFILYSILKFIHTNAREFYVQTYKHTYIHVLSAYVHMYGPIVCSCEAGARDEGSLMRWRRECRQRRARQKQNKAGKQSIDRKSKEQRAKRAECKP